MQLKRTSRVPLIALALLVVVVLASLVASVRVYSVLSRSFPPAMGYDGGEQAGPMTVYPGYRIGNNAKECNRRYEISFGVMYGTIQPEMRVFLHVFEDGHEMEEELNSDDFTSIVHDGEEIVLPNPCTFEKEAIGRVLGIRPEVEPITCQVDYLKYLPDKAVAAQIELYGQAWPVQMTKSMPKSNIRPLDKFRWDYCP